MLKLNKDHLKTDYKLIITKNNEVVLKSKDKGIKKLYEIIKGSPEILEDAEVFDTVVGQAAGNLYIHGKIQSLETNLLTEKALQLFKEHGIQVKYKKLVPQILNINKTDLCPMEKIASNSKNSKELISNIELFFS